uniref:Pyridoxal-dependent decarboxylase domain-containing protein 1 n=2 Tax=Graphocephala atropunctata TaxID=36148 RepID=A0A1B6K9W1_9HEMI
MLSQQPGGEGGVITVADVIAKPVNTNLLFEVVASAVVFQFVPEGCQDRVAPYYDKLNSWLGQILQRDAPLVPVELCELEHSGVVLRFCPLEAVSVPTPADTETFINCLDQQLEILSATVSHKETFQRLVSASSRLRLVEMPGWAGLGGVRYIPQGWESLLLTDQAKEELNRLNIQMVDRLRATDAAFSLGEGTDGLACVRFGMVTADTDVTELLGLVESVGKQEEDSWKFIDTMAEVVKKGIETATLGLQRENEEKLWQDGILRQVPVFGSLVNWWSPNSKEGAGIKGRSLDLTAGVVASTENIYKYHMQGVTTLGAKGPPEPLVQTPVAGHSRTPSVSSQQSNANSPH